MLYFVIVMIREIIIKKIRNRAGNSNGVKWNGTPCGQKKTKFNKSQEIYEKQTFCKITR